MRIKRNHEEEVEVNNKEVGNTAMVSPTSLFYDFILLNTVFAFCNKILS